eukprot:TRINITY_DN24723_c0_g1_i1.p1 TRINITY_DN24723_c0_g1~~TRINITY_DN24723_c0_g1_i1.p1  ORF type:complete len:203 (+),score=16.99 TRINITY_DN24723_c0_g1_i1:51-659(+)
MLAVHAEDWAGVSLHHLKIDRRIDEGPSGPAGAMPSLCQGSACALVRRGRFSQRKDIGAQAELVAIKSFRGPRATLSTARELLNSTARSYLVKLYAVFWACDTIFIVQELMDAGSLAKMQKLVDGSICQIYISCIVTQITEALCKLHAILYVHGHIEPSHILLNSRGIVKLTCLNVAQDSISGMPSGHVGVTKPLYASPEHA